MRLPSRRQFIAQVGAWAAFQSSTPALLPPQRRTDWTFTGIPGGIPNRTSIFATFGPAATAAAINAAINAAPAESVIFLSAGTYTPASLGGAINISKNNVTLRGAGADQTTITGQGQITMVNGGSIGLGTAITGATKGSRTFTAASLVNLAVGVMIEIDRDDDPNLVVNPGGGNTRGVTQVNMITAINGNVVTVRNPFFYDFSTGNPKIKFYFVQFLSNSGVENLKLDHGGVSGNTNFFVNFADRCWIKGVESAFAVSYHFIFTGTLNMELRDNFVHDGGSGPNNSGFNVFGNYTFGGNSNAKIENNIFNKCFPAIEINNSSSGLYIGYNYVYGSPSQSGTNLVTWTFDDGHAPFNIMNLYEGNIGEMWGVDGYFGGAGLGTVLRNYFTGFNPNYSVKGDAVQIKRLSYYYNLIGNVVGSANQAPVGYLGCGGPYVYQLGMPNIGNCDLIPNGNDVFVPPGGYPDPKVTSTLLRWGNYDYFTATTRFFITEVPADVPVPSNNSIPVSYIYTTTPSWWPGTIPWPPIGSDITGGNGDTAGHVNKIPAQVTWETLDLLHGGPFH